MLEIHTEQKKLDPIFLAGKEEFSREKSRDTSGDSSTYVRIF